MYAIYLNVKDRKSPEIIEFVDELDTFYKLIKCDTIDIVYRRINGRYYNIICDDCGLLKKNPIISAVDEKQKPALFGNLIIAGEADFDGELMGITLEDATRLLRNSFYNAVVSNYKEKPIMYTVLEID